MKTTADGFAGRMARGAVGGLAGTMALQGLRIASQRFVPASMPPMKAPDQYMVSEAERRLPKSVAKSVPPLMEKLAGKTLAIGYGVLAGSVCSAIGWRKLPNPLRGAALGLTTWAVGYLGWLPLSGLMPSVRKQKPAQVAGPIVRHIAYGIISVEVSELLRRAFSQRAARTSTRQPSTAARPKSKRRSQRRVSQPS